VEPQQVVLGYAEATDGRVGFQATMWPMPVVAMEPMEQLSRSLIGVVVGASVGPFAQCCLNEAFGLAVSPRRVGPGEDLTKAEAFAGCSEYLRPIARTIVRHHALDPDTKLCKISNGGLKEGDRSLLTLIGQDLHERDPRGIVDADMDALPTDAVVTVNRARISPGDTMAHRADPTELFDIEVDEFGCSRS
jgi:hypothetical protein